MIAMRGLQGFAGGVLIPMAFTLVLTKLPKAQQPIGLAIFALSVTFAPRSARPSAAISPRIMVLEQYVVTSRKARTTGWGSTPPPCAPCSR